MGSVLVLLFSAAPAQAQNLAPTVAPEGGEELFGQAGQITFDANFRAAIEYEKQSGVSGSPEQSETSVVIQPSLLFFIAPNLAVGGAVSLVHVSSEGDNSVTGFGIGPAAAFNVPLSPKVSLFPSLGLFYLHNSWTVNGADFSGYDLGLSLAAPLLLHPVPHLFFGVGPHLSYEFVSKIEGDDAPKALNVGLFLTIGGWM